MMTDSGEQKGLQQTLEERGFNVTDMRARCSRENDQCCMAWLLNLSKQDDFVNQVSMRHSSKKSVMNVSSFRNSTVRLIRLKW
jgi:hypothetical protein